MTDEMIIPEAALLGYAEALTEWRKNAWKFPGGEDRPFKFEYTTAGGNRSVFTRERVPADRFGPERHRVRVEVNPGD